MTTKTPSSVYKIRFTDCDMLGHLNNSRYLDYMINAREDHLKDHHQFDINTYYQKGLAWVISNHEITYVRPALYNEYVTIQSTLLHVDQEQLLVEILMLNADKNQVKAIMRSKFIPINLKSGKKENHTPDFLEWAKTLENNEVQKEHTLTERLKLLHLSFKQ